MVSIHEEYIKKIAQTLNAPYQVRKVESGLQETSGTVRTQKNCPESAGINPTHRQKFRGKDRKSNGMAPNNNRYKRLSLEVSLSSVPAMQCIECNDRFPLMDYLYTKKTGLCIRCWEEKEI
jgi:hypothetical protein